MELPIGAEISSLTNSLSLLLQGPPDWAWRMHPIWGWGFGMMFMMMLFWILVIVTVVIALRWFLNQGKRDPEDSALAILRERFARGEIDKDEFESRMRQLS